MSSNVILKPLRLASLLILLTLWSCGGKMPESPSDLIPPDAGAVAALDLDRICKAADSQAIHGTITESAEMAFRIFVPSEIIGPLTTILAQSGDAVDRSGLICFRTAKGYTVAAMPVSDPERLAESLADFRQAESGLEGFEVFGIGNRCVAVSGKIMVIAPEEATIRECLEKSRTLPVSSLEGVSNYIADRQDAVRIALPAADVIGKEMKGLWLCSSVRFTESSAVVEISAMKPDGTPDAIGERIAEPLDPDVVQFFPQRASIAIASGRQPDGGGLLPAEKLTGRIFPSAADIKADGTSAWYGQPAGSLDPDNLLNPWRWNLATIVRIPDSEVPAAMKSMEEIVGKGNPEEPGTGIVTYRQRDLSISYGYVEGYFTESYNGIVSFGNPNSLTPLFAGARMAAIIDIPLDSQLMKAAGLPCGTSLSLKVTDENIRLKMSFFGNTEPPLAVISGIPAIAGVLNYLTAGSLM